MKIKQLIYTAIILFPFFGSHKAKAQDGKSRHRSVTINQTVVNGKIINADTIITYTDTTTRTINSKEVSMELPYTNGTGVLIENIYRKINIRQSKNGKVKLSTTIFYYDEPSFTNEQWLEKLNIKMQKLEKGIYVASNGIDGNVSNWGDGTYQFYADAQQVYSSLVPVSPKPPVAKDSTIVDAGGSKGQTVSKNGAMKEVKINSGTQKGSTVTQNGAYQQSTLNGTTVIRNGASGEVVINGQENIYGVPYVREYPFVNTAVFDEKGNKVYSSNSLRRELNIYIPDGAKLEIRSKYGDIVIDYDIEEMNAVVNNASLDMLNVKNLTVSGGYANVSAGNVKAANIKLNNGKFSVKNVISLLANTRYTKVDAGNVDTLKLQSVSDDYDIDEVKNFIGKKTYGSLRVDKLTGSFDLNGSSADLKIRNIEPTVYTITIDNKYADLRLPVTNLENYEVTFMGNYSSVFAPFDRKESTIEKQVGNARYTIDSNVMPRQAQAAIGTTEFSRRNIHNFTATVGDTKGIHTIFKLVCNSCNVDFK